MNNAEIGDLLDSMPVPTKGRAVVLTKAQAARIGIHPVQWMLAKRLNKESANLKVFFA